MMKPQMYIVMPESDVIEKYDQLISRLDASQRERVESTKAAINRKLSLYGLLLVRCIAVSGLGRSNRQLSFKSTGRGKPYIADEPEFHFSISHTHGCVAVAVFSKSVGVDVESIREVNYKLAQRFYSQTEKDYLGNADDKDIAFTEIWTRKEAVVKRSGQGVGGISITDTFSAELCHKIYTQRYGEYIYSLCCDGEMSAKPLYIDENELISIALDLDTTI